MALAGPGSTAWVLADDVPERTLGPALVWADREHVEELHIVVDGPADAAATVARQAGLFAPPAPQVWIVAGTTLVPAAAAPPVRQPDAPAPPELVDLLMDAGVEIVAEGGLVRGEVNGLEVARIVHGTTTSGVPIAEPQLEVGVGKADRELTAMVHGGLAPVDQLSRVVDIVREHRRPGVPPASAQPAGAGTLAAGGPLPQPGHRRRGLASPGAGRPRPRQPHRARHRHRRRGRRRRRACRRGLLRRHRPRPGAHCRRRPRGDRPVRRACCWRCRSATITPAPAGSRPASARRRTSFLSPVTGGPPDRRPPPARWAIGVATLARRARPPR